MKRITAIGDSVTRGIDASSWAYRLMQRLDPNEVPVASQFSPWSGLAENQKLTTSDWEFFNAGIQGDTTTQELARFSSDVLGHATDYAIIAGGVNDLNAGTAVGTIEANLAAMADLAAAAGVIPVMVTLTPYNGGTAQQRANLLILNAWIRAYAYAMGYGLIDWFEALESPVGSGNSPWLADGTHTTTYGDIRQADCIDLAIFYKYLSQPVNHWVVRADGKVQDLITGAFATVNTVEGAALPSFQKRPDGRGYEGFFAVGTTCDIPTTGWNYKSGTVLIVGQCDWTTATQRRFFRTNLTGGTAKNVTQFYKATGQIAGSFYGADEAAASPALAYPTTVATPANAQQCVFGFMWDVNEVYMHLNGVRNADVGTATDAMDGINAFAQLGRSSTNYFDGGATIGQCVVYDRMLSLFELASEYARFVGGPPVPSAESITLGNIQTLTAGAIAAVKERTDNLPDDPMAVTDYTAPDNTGIAAAKTAAEAVRDAYVGSGDKQVRLVVKDSGGVAIADAEVSISTDLAGDIVILGPVTTNAQGKTPILMLNAGTYYRWASKSGVTFTNPQSFTVT